MRPIHDEYPEVDPHIINVKRSLLSSSIKRDVHTLVDRIVKGG